LNHAGQFIPNIAGETNHISNSSLINLQYLISLEALQIMNPNKTPYWEKKQKIMNKASPESCK
jgi:hypothetical protein